MKTATEYLDIAEYHAALASGEATGTTGIKNAINATLAQAYATMAVAAPQR